ncbi:MAG: hypothetical protein JWN64_23 [Parcubacteria group bacterium]|nr:hypothetical protein [Parcubacteria group bacterium]
MRDVLIILGMCVAAIAAGAWLFFSTPSAFTISPLDAGALTSTGKPPSIDTQVSTTTQAVRPVEFTAIDTGTASELKEKKNYAIYSKDELGRIWGLAHDNEPVPDVDFSKEYVVAIFAGQKSSGGYSVKVSKIEDSTTTRKVYITLTAPGSGCITIQALTSPYQFVRVSNTTLTLSRQENTETTSCN